MTQINPIKQASLKKLTNRPEDTKETPNLILVLINGTMIMWALVMFFVFWNSYRGIDWTYSLSYDVVDGWCKKDFEGLGEHCFGDFGLMYEIGRSANTFLSPGPGATVTPFSAVLFRVISLAEYNFALIVISLTYCLLMVHMLVHATSRLQTTFRIYMIVFFGILSLGMLVALDRSNPIVIIPYLLYWYLHAFEKKKYGLAVFLLAFMVSFKFWAILFVIPFLVAKKFKLLILSFLLSLSLYVIPLLILPGNLFLEVANNVNSVLDREYGARISKHSISTYSFLLKLNCLATSCNTEEIGSQISYGILIVLLLLAGYCIIAFFSMRTLSDSPEIKYLPLISLGFLAIPEAASYNAVLMSTVIAKFTWHITNNVQQKNGEFDSRKTEIGTELKATMVSLILTVPPIAAFGNLVFEDFKTLRIQTVSIPVIWNLLLFLVALRILRMRHLERGEQKNYNNSTTKI